MNNTINSDKVLIDNIWDHSRRTTSQLDYYCVIKEQ